MGVEHILFSVRGACFVLLRLLCLTAVPPTLRPTVYPFCVPPFLNGSANGLVWGSDSVTLHALGRPGDLAPLSWGKSLLSLSQAVRLEGAYLLYPLHRNVRQLFCLAAAST